jgi:hypothetical protein
MSVAAAYYIGRGSLGSLALKAAVVLTAVLGLTFLYLWAHERQCPGNVVVQVRLHELGPRALADRQPVVVGLPSGLGGGEALRDALPHRGWWEDSGVLSPRSQYRVVGDYASLEPSPTEAVAVAVMNPLDARVDDAFTVATESRQMDRAVRGCKAQGPYATVVLEPGTVLILRRGWIFEVRTMDAGGGSARTPVSISTVRTPIGNLADWLEGMRRGGA